MNPQDPYWHGPGLTDVRMMAAVHSGFRREIGLSPGLVRAVSPGNLPRAKVIADHHEGDPEAITAAMSTVSPPLRRLLSAAGRRSFSGYARTIHGTSTPERGVGQRVSHR